MKLSETEADDAPLPVLPYAVPPRRIERPSFNQEQLLVLGFGGSFGLVVAAFFGMSPDPHSSPVRVLAAFAVVWVGLLAMGISLAAGSRRRAFFKGVAIGAIFDVILLVALWPAVG